MISIFYHVLNSLKTQFCNLSYHNFISNTNNMFLLKALEGFHRLYHLPHFASESFMIRRLKQIISVTNADTNSQGIDFKSLKKAPNSFHLAFQ